jgi:hypothetical protein
MKEWIAVLRAADAAARWHEAGEGKAASQLPAMSTIARKNRCIFIPPMIIP